MALAGATVVYTHSNRSIWLARPEGLGGSQLLGESAGPWARVGSLGLTDSAGSRVLEVGPGTESRSRKRVLELRILLLELSLATGTEVGSENIPLGTEKSLDSNKNARFLNLHSAGR